MMRFAESMSGLIAFGIYFGAFAIWCYGITVCVKTSEIFWAVFSFAMPPVGFIIGLYNLIF